MPIENRNLEAGTRLVARYKKETHVCEVVQTDEGLRYRLADGREFRSPSAAGSAVMGGSACNGWRFWSLEGTLSEPRAPKTKEPKQPKASVFRERKPKAAKPKGKKNGNGVKVNDGLDAFKCETCGAEFPSSAEATEHVASAHPAEEPTT